MGVVVAAAVLAQAPVQAFRPADGHWWMAATAEQRDGYAIGDAECSGVVFSHALVSMSRFDFENAITAYYRQHASQLSVSVPLIIRALKERWIAAHAHPFTSIASDDPQDGDTWWQATPDNRDGIIRGFLSCQIVSGGMAPPVVVTELVRRVSEWYGIEPLNESRLARRTDDKLAKVIMAMEKPVSPPVPSH